MIESIHGIGLEVSITSVEASCRTVERRIHYRIRLTLINEAGRLVICDDRPQNTITEYIWTKGLTRTRSILTTSMKKATKASYYA